jgi:hypothetical protein
MRVHLSKSLLRVLDGTMDTLNVYGHVEGEVTPEVEVGLQKIPQQITTSFNYFAPVQEGIDYVSPPMIYMPDEFALFISVEHLGRLAREVLIDTLPLKALAWEVHVAQLWIGGQGEVLSKDERGSLKRAMREVWALPVQRKVFVLDDTSLRDLARQLGTRDAIREAGGVVHEQISPACDYYVTDRPEAAELAREQGATQVIDTLTAAVMLGDRD